MMPDGTLRFVIDCVIICLLLATMISTGLMYRRLKKVQAVKADFSQMISDFLRASGRAEDALKGMTVTAESVSDKLDKAIQRGELTADELRVMLESGERIAARMDAAVDKASGIKTHRDRDPLDSYQLEEELIAEPMPEAPQPTSNAGSEVGMDYEELADRAARAMIRDAGVPSAADSPAPSPAAPARPQSSAPVEPQRPAAPLSADGEADKGMNNVFLQAEAQGIDPVDALFGDDAPDGIRKVVPMPERNNLNRAARQPVVAPARTAAPTGGPSRSEQELSAALAAARSRIAGQGG